ncbi:helix-turn-helix domain-containing protein [Novosphingobium profundi]|uniref:IclR family transcriptional regulator domain-containing protein n=1 Tax=Novosphingobium profundi TaxID=1774954 RepID=UPI001BDAF427|nr:helix-turn-helix domain-containing protein [Novosphingobium profundi]MBT0668207.1 helix-turn-helix domain-containing protein [Novosphingobium profundi]
MDNGVPIRSVSRSLSVLRTINHQREVSLTELVRLEELPYPTMFRIVQTLLHEGLIERDETGKRYRPTALVHTLSSGYDDTALRSRAQPHMSALTRKIGWPVLLSVRVGARMVIRASTHHETTLTFHNWEAGTAMPLEGSATGMAWLAYLPEDHARDLVRWGVGPHGIGMFRHDLSIMLDAMARIREQGYAWRPSLFGDENKTSSISVPVLDGERIVAVLTLTYFSAAMKSELAIDRYVTPLQQAARAIAAAVATRPN